MKNTSRKPTNSFVGVRQYGQHILYAVIAFGGGVELFVAVLEEGEKHARGELNRNSKYRYSEDTKFDFNKFIH